MRVPTNLIVILLAGFVSANPKFPVEKCELKDSKCLQKAFQYALPAFMAGMPDIGTEVLDVMDLDHIAFELAGFKFTLDDAKMNGLKNAIVDKVKWDTIKQKVEIMYHLDCIIKGKYTAGGKLLILPITGDGVCTLDMKNMVVKLVTDYDKMKNSEGKDIIALTKLTFDFEPKGKVNFDATNLFNGNKQLSDTMMKFLNENWKEVTSTFGKPLVESANKKIIKNVKKYLEVTPIEDIAINA